MASMKITLFTLLISYTLASLSVGLEEVSGSQDASALINNNNPTIHLSDSVKSVTAMMQSVDKLPSCNYIASRTLINSCSQLDQSSAASVGEGLDVMLDQAKSIYAARLSICELLEANAPLPSACSAFKPTPRNTRKQGFRGFFSKSGPTPPVALYEIYDDETAKNLKTCSSSLTSKPQWWTSYSNARQNAVVMCHAMRAEVEKDDIIEFTKMMMDVANKVTADMSAISKQSPAVLKDFQAMRSGMESFQGSLNEGFEDVQQALADFWSRVRDEVNAVSEDVKKVGSNLDIVLMNSRQAASNLNDQRILSEDSIRSLIRMVSIVDDAKKVSTDSLALQVDVQKQNNVALNFVINMAGNIQILDEHIGRIHNDFARIDNSLNNTLGVVEAIGRDAANLPSFTSLLGHIVSSSLVARLAGHLSVGIFMSGLIYVLLDTSGVLRTSHCAIMGFVGGIACFFASANVTWGPILPIQVTPTCLSVGACWLLSNGILAACLCRYYSKHATPSCNKKATQDREEQATQNREVLDTSGAIPDTQLKFDD